MNSIFSLDATHDSSECCGQSHLGRKVNHSHLHPNAEMKMYDYKGKPRLFLIAIENIPPNTEILYDYNDSESDLFWMKNS